MKKGIIGIIDYGGGNIGSVRNSLKYLGYKSQVVRNSEHMEKVDKLIIPGVGEFSSAVGEIKKIGIFDAIGDWIDDGNPFLGICLGYQMLFEKSEESPGTMGLGIIEGEVKRFRKGKVPHIGWNWVEASSNSLIESGYYYFVNSYYPEPSNGNYTIGTTENAGTVFASAIEFDNAIGVQFHPEKSGMLGLRFLKRWLEC